MPAANESFDVRATHDGLRTNTYDLVQDGNVVQTKPVSDRGAVEAGAISFSYPNGLPAGSYQFQVNAIGTGGAGTSPVHSETIDVQAPADPGPPRIITNP